MLRYRVTEKRAYISTILIDADDEEDARMCQGEIIDESSTDSWSDEIVSVKEVDSEENCA
jgi:hypothetical protein